MQEKRERRAQDFSDKRSCSSRVKAYGTPNQSQEEWRMMGEGGAGSPRARATAYNLHLESTCAVTDKRALRPAREMIEPPSALQTDQIRHSLSIRAMLKPRAQRPVGLGLPHRQLFPPAAGAGPRICSVPSELRCRPLSCYGIAPQAGTLRNKNCRGPQSQAAWFALLFGRGVISGTFFPLKKYILAIISWGRCLKRAAMQPSTARPLTPPVSCGPVSAPLPE